MESRAFLKSQPKRFTTVANLSIIPQQRVPLPTQGGLNSPMKCFFVPSTKLFWHMRGGYKTKLHPTHTFEDLFTVRTDAAESSSIEATNLQPLTGAVLAKNRLRTAFVVVRSTLDLNVVKGMYSLGDGEYWLFRKRGTAFKKTAAPKSHLRECCVIGMLVRLVGILSPRLFAARMFF